MAATPSPPRILSIQSHVTSGYVGNKAAVFPLQLLGFDVDVLNSCNLSNHTGYTHGAPGPRLSGEHLAEILAGLDQNGLLKNVTHLLTGYIGTSSFLNSILHTVKLLRANSDTPLVYICDPVLGDDGKLYVSHDLIQIYVQQVLPLATVLTPNPFELGLLTNSTIHSEHAAFAACDLLHDRHLIPTIVVTGTCFKATKDTVSILVSRKDGPRFAVDAPYLNASFTGTGDLIAALLLAWTHKLPDDLPQACARAMATVSAVLNRTNSNPVYTKFCQKPELKLIQSRDDILNPPLHLVSVRYISR